MSAMPESVLAIVARSSSAGSLTIDTPPRERIPCRSGRSSRQERRFRHRESQHRERWPPSLGRNPPAAALRPSLVLLRGSRHSVSRARLACHARRSPKPCRARTIAGFALFVNTRSPSNSPSHHGDRRAPRGRRGAEPTLADESSREVFRGAARQRRRSTRCPRVTRETHGRKRISPLRSPTPHDP